MDLTAKDIKHIARLARLTLTEEEIKQYRREISGIIRYIDTLAEVDVTKEEATYRLSEGAPDLRIDVALPWEESEQAQALSAAKQKKSYIEVPRVFGDL